MNDQVRRVGYGIINTVPTSCQPNAFIRSVIEPIALATKASLETQQALLIPSRLSNL